MKDKHNVILILVSSSKFNSLFRRFIKILGFNCSSFFSGVSSFLGYIISKIHLITSRLHLVFSTSLSFYHPFITGVLHGGSTWWFVKDSFHSSFVLQDILGVKISQAILQNKLGAQHMFCFEEFKYSSSCIPK